MKKVSVTVKTRAKQDHVQETSEEELKVFVKEAPSDGKANKAVIKLLSKHFKVPQKNIELVTGHKFNKKLFNIIF